MDANSNPSEIAFPISVTIDNAITKFSPNENILGLQIAYEILRTHPEYGKQTSATILDGIQNLLNDALSDPTFIKYKRQVTEWLLISRSKCRLKDNDLFHGRLFLLSLTLVDILTYTAFKNSDLIPKLVDEMGGNPRKILTDTAINEYRERFYSKDTNIEKSIFRIGNVVFRLGDMMDNEVLRQTDFLIFPAATNGETTESIELIAEDLGIPKPKPGKLGTLELYVLKSKEKNLHVGWAKSVEAINFESNPFSINTICSDIVLKAKEYRKKIVNLPLLGTGSGELSPIVIAEIMLNMFTGKRPKIEYWISVLDHNVFTELRSHFMERTLESKSSLELNINSSKIPEIKSKLHSDLFTVDEDDVLQFDIIADNLFAILKDESTKPPLNIGILAPWGRGKTSLMKRLQSKFDKERKKLLKEKAIPKVETPKLKLLSDWIKAKIPGTKHDIPYATVWFNPWNYQSSDMIWAGLADAVIKQVVSQLPSKIDQEIFYMQLNLARIDKDKLRSDLQLRFFLQTLKVFTWITSVIAFIIVAWYYKANAFLWVGIPGGLLSLLTNYFSKLKPADKTISEAFEKYTKSPKYPDKIGTFHEVEEDLYKVLDLCIDKDRPLVIFIDDLDRCSPSKVVEVVEAINVFMNGKYNFKCYFILGMDAELVAGALEVSYEKMKGKLPGKETEHGSVGWYFLDKFIQLPFVIPVMNETKKQLYLKGLLSDKNNKKDLESEHTSTDMDVTKVENVFSKLMSEKPENGEIILREIDLTKIEQQLLDQKIIESRLKSEDQANEINEQIQLYSKFLGSDPRALKRFANLLRFYSSYQFLRMKKGETFVQPRILAKWLSLMLRYPQFVRWIQWDAENKGALNYSAEFKTHLLDELIAAFTKKNVTSQKDNYNLWLEQLLPDELNLDGKQVNVGLSTDLPWIKSRQMLELLLFENIEDARLQNALLCNIW